MSTRSAARETLVPGEAKDKKSPKVFAFSFRHFGTIPTNAPVSHNRRMEATLTNELETAREIDDLHETIRSQRLTITFQEQQLRTLRVRVNRYERILGMEEDRAA